MKRKSFLSQLRASSLGLAAASLLIPLLAQPAFAVTASWTGSTNNTWDTTTGANWGGTAFASTNDVLFAGSPTNQTVTQSGALTIGAITLDSTWTGSVTLSQANTVSGATTISGGTLILTNAAGLGASAVTVNGPGSLTINPGGASSTVANTVSGGGLITAQDPGTASGNTLTLSGIYSGFTGTLNILAGASNNGKVALSNATQANVPSSSATVQVRSGATLYLFNALNYGFSTQLYGTGNSENLGALRLEGGATLAGGVTLFANSNIGANSGTGTISGSIGESGGSFGFTKVGAQTVALSGSNSYSGTTTISAGTLSVGHNNALGTSSVAFNGGTLANTTNVTLANNLSTASSTGIITSSGGTMVLNGNITGAKGLTLNPTNKITLAGTNNFANAASGSNTFYALLVNAGAGGVDITGSTTVGPGGSTDLNGAFAMLGTSTVAIPSGGSLTVNGSGTSTTTSPNSIIGQNAAGTSTLLVNGGTFTVGANTGFVLGNGNNNNIASAGVLTISSGTATINRGAVATTGNGTDTRLIMMGKDSNSATGTINLNGGTLATDRQFVRDGSSTGQAGIANFVFGGGALKALGTQTDWLQSTTATSAGQNQGTTGGTVDTAALALSSVTTTAVSTIDPNGFSVAINSAISGAGGFNINSSTGTGTVTFGGANSYTGATAVSSGTLVLSGNGAINSSSGITINGSGAKFSQIGTVASTPAITLTQGTLDGTGTVGAVTVGAGTGGIVANGNGATTALTLGSLTFSGAGTASLRLAGGATTNSPALSVTGALTLSGGAGSVTVNIKPTSALTNGSTYQLISYGGSFTGNASTDFSIAPGVLTGRQSGAFASTAASNGFITLTVSGDTPVWSGASGGVLVEYPQNTALTTGNLALKTGHTATDFWTNDGLEFNDTYNVGAGDAAVTQTTVDIQGGATNAGGIAANSLIFNNSAVDYSITSSVGKGITAGSVTKNGTGAVTISNSNSYSGATTLNSGRLNINNASAIGTGALVIVSGTIDNTSGSALTLATNNAQNWNGDFAFGGSNDLNLGTGAVTLGASRTVTTNGAGNLTIGGVIGGSGFGLAKAGTGTLVLNGANTFNGGFAINGGTVRAGNNAALGASANALSFGSASNGKLQVNGNSITVASLNGDSTATIENSNATNGTLTDSSTSSDSFAGTIQDGSAGTLALVKNGSNTLTLSGNNSYSGGTTISTGTLSVGNNNALGTGSVAFNGGTLGNTTGITLGNALSTASGGGTITSSGGTMVLNGNITGANGLTLNPTNKITLAGTNSFSTSASGVGFTINAGAVDITGSTTVGAGNSTGGGNLSLGGATTVTVQSGGALSIVGSTFATTPPSIIGQNATGTSTFVVNGGSLTVGGNTGFILGNNRSDATGVLTISSGTATINRGSTTATDSRSFVSIGRDLGNGTINLNGGTLATDRNFVRDGSSSGGANGGTANFVFGGGTLKALANQSDWLNSALINSNQQALSSVTTTSAASTIDSNSFSVGVNSAISGAGGFNIIDGSGSGTGAVTFGGASAYTGATNVNSGKLVVSGSLNGTSAVSVARGATLQVTGLVNSAATASVAGTLSGSGTVGAISVSNGGTIAPGTASSPAVLTGNGNITLGDLSGVAHLGMKIGSTTAGTGYDQLQLLANSTLNLTNVQLDGSLINGFTPTTFASWDGSNNLLTSGDKFFLVIGAGNSLSGQHFANATVGGDAYTGGFDSIVIGSQEFAISYTASFSGATFTGGNDIALMAVPEPGTWAMLLSGLGMLSFWQRSRRKAA